jgi:hypothetical protein
VSSIAGFFVRAILLSVILYMMRPFALFLPLTFASCFTFDSSSVLHSGEILSLTACSGKSLSLTVWGLSRSGDDDYYNEDAAPSVKQIRWLPPQTPNNSNAAGCYFLLMHDDNIVCLSPSGQQGGLTSPLQYHHSLRFRHFHHHFFLSLLLLLSLSDSNHASSLSKIMQAK